MSRAKKNLVISDVRTYSFRFSRAILWVGLIDLIMFACFTFAAPLFWEKAVFSVIALLGAVILTACINLRITLSADDFSVRNFFRVTRTYKYTEITGTEHSHADFRLYMDKRHVDLSLLYEDYPTLIILLTDRYRRQNGGKGIPKLPDRKCRFDLFNGHVREAGVFAGIFTAITLMLATTLILSGIAYRRYEKEDTSFERVSFKVNSLSANGDDLMLRTADDGQEYRILCYKQTLADAQSFLEDCAAGTVFDVEYTLVGPKENKHKSVRSLAADGTVYMDRRVMTEHLQQNILTAMWFMGGLLLLWLGFCACAVAVGRHPERYSDRIVHLFFKPGYLKSDYSDKRKRPGK